MDKQNLNSTTPAENTLVSGQVEEKSLSNITYGQQVFRRFMKNRLAVVGSVMLITIVVLCVFAPFFTSYDPILDMDPSLRMLRPGEDGFFLGTDDYGRDLWSRILYGGRISVTTGLAVALMSSIVGIIIGCISGYCGGWVDTILMRATDIMISFPFLIIAICILAAFGSSQRNIVLTLAVTGWPGFARLTRGQVLSVKSMEYVESAKTAGYKDMRIIFRHILPNCMGPIIVKMTLSMGGAILSAASLNFLGLGVDAAQPDWGSMLNQGRAYITSAPYLTIIPGVAIALTVLSVNWIGDGLRDALDPKLRK